MVGDLLVIVEALEYYNTTVPMVIEMAIAISMELLVHLVISTMQSPETAYVVVQFIIDIWELRQRAMQWQ